MSSTPPLMTSPPMPDEKSAGELRQFLRLLMSNNDFKHANRIAKHLLTLDWQEEEREGRLFLLEALNAAMVMAYCRPFSGNDRHTRPKIPDLPLRFLDCLNDEERVLHNVAMDDRNTVVAHSDSAAWNYQPVVLAVGDRKVLVPWSAYTRAPLVREAVAILASASEKLMAAVVAERMAREPELIDYFPVTSLEEIEAEHTQAKTVGEPSAT